MLSEDEKIKQALEKRNDLDENGRVVPKRVLNRIISKQSGKESFSDKLKRQMKEKNLKKSHE